MTREELSYCRICAAACGIVVTVDGDRVLRVRGDEDHPASRGYTCSKGRGLPAWHHSSRRLDRPRLGRVDVTWDELLADLAGRLDAIIDASGPDAVALYLATGLAYDAAGQIAASRWLPSIGSRSFLTAVTVDNAPVLVAAELVSGQPMLNPVWDPTAPGMMVFVGTNPVVSHGYGTAIPDPIRYVREYRARGGRVWVLDPRRTETAAVADVHLPVRPGGDVAVLAAIAKALLERGADARELREHCDATEVAALRAALAEFTVERAAAAADVDPALLDQLVADVRALGGRVAMQCGTGVTMSRDGVLAEWLRWVILIASGSLDCATGMYFHRGVVNRLRQRRPGATASAGPPPGSRPELPRVVGQLPAVALAGEIEAGNIRALFLAGGNPLTAFPQPARVKAALAQLDVLAVIDVADNPLTEIATHVLPATGQLERADITLSELTALKSGLQATRAVVAPVGDRKPVWWMFAALQRAMGRSVPGGVDPDLMNDEDALRGVLARAPLEADAVFAAGPRGVSTPVEYGWVHDELLLESRWSIAPAALLERLAAYADPAPAPFVLAPRREMAWSNSIAYGANAVGPVVRVHPGSVRDDGTGRVAITSDHGDVTASFVEDPTVREGVVSMTHGHADASPGELTSENVNVDSLTAMPRASGVVVGVTMMNGEPHEARQMAESFGVDAERYDRARPRYPDALVQRIVAASPGREFLDVGCGTGIAARQFQALGCTVLGIDPDARMAELARERGVEVEVATFETWEGAGRRFDAVVAGQAWHWVDQVAGAVKAAQVLRPGGRLAVFGNVFDSPPVVANALHDAYRRVAPDSPFNAPVTRGALDVYQEMFANAVDGMARARGFEDVEQWRFDWEQSYTREQWLDLLPTTGALTRFSPDQLAEVLDVVGAAIDSIGGGFTMTYTTLAATARKVS